MNVRQYNPSYQGAGTEYGLRIREGTPTATPTESTTPTQTPSTTPSPSGVRTLILVNRTRITQLYSENEATQLMDKLNELAQHQQVRGEVIRLDNNTEVSTAYAAWTSDQGDIEKANQVTTAIRNIVLTYLQQREGIEYLVLVGDDRALPLRRILDNTPTILRLLISILTRTIPLVRRSKATTSYQTIISAIVNRPWMRDANSLYPTWQLVA